MAKNGKHKGKIPFAVLRKGVLSAVLGVSMLAGGIGLLSGCEQAPNVAGKNGSTWLSGENGPVATEGVVGDFYYDTDDFKIYKKGANGWVLVSTIKSTVEINSDGFWVIDGEITEIKATATQISINNDGYWVVGGTVTNMKAAATQVSINDAGYWVVGGVVSEYKATGKDGLTPEIKDGIWWIGTTNTGVKALAEDGDNGKSAYQLALEGDFEGSQEEWLESLKGSNGLTPEIKDGVWWIGTTNTGVKALAEDGDDGKSAYQLALEGNFDGTLEEWLESLKGSDGLTPEVKDGYWWVGTKNTGIPATGKSAYEIALELDPSIGSKAEWITSLKGETGSIWLTGEGEPKVAARVGDYYLDIKTSDVYIKTEDSWSKTANIKGNKGEDALTIKSFRKVVDTDVSKWGMVYYYELIMSDNSVVKSESVTEVIDNHYYTATEDGDVEALLAAGVKYIKLGNNVSLIDNYDEVSNSNTLRLVKDLNLDLNGYKLTSNNRIVVTGAKINITNGLIDFETKEDYAAIQLQGGASAQINDVELHNLTGSGVSVLASSLKIVDSKITAAVFGVTTDAASIDYYDVDIEIKDSLISTLNGNNYDNAAILMNVPGSLLVENSEVYGDRQAIIARGGDTTIKNSKVVLTGAWYAAQEADEDPETTGDVYMRDGKQWEDYNKVPSAAIVLGNNTTSAYQYAANLTFENAEVISKKMFIKVEIAPYVEDGYWYIDGQYTGIPEDQPAPSSEYRTEMVMSNIYAQGNTTEEGKEYIGATFNIKNENLSAVDLLSASINYSTVQMSIEIANRKTLDEAMKFVKMRTFGSEYPEQEIAQTLQVLNLHLTQDIIILEEELSYSKLYEYEQANLYIANNEYCIYASALSILVSNKDEFMGAYNLFMQEKGGPIKLTADIELDADPMMEAVIPQLISFGLIDVNGYELTFVNGEIGGGVDEEEQEGQVANITVDEDYRTNVGISISEIQATIYNQIENSSDGEKEYYTLAQLEENGMALNNYYVKFATITGISEFHGIIFNGSEPTVFVDEGEGIANVPVSIGNNVYIDAAPFVYDAETGELSIAAVILATEMITANSIALCYDGDENGPSEYSSEFQAEEAQLLTLNPTSENNEILDQGDGSFIVTVNDTSSIFILDYDENTIANMDEPALAVTKMVWNKDGSVENVSYGFALTDVATTNETYTIGLYAMNGEDLTDPSVVEEYTNKYLSYTAYIHGQGLINATFNFELVAQEQ